MADAYEIAAWRFEQIAPFVDPSLDATRRRVAMRDRSSRSVTWPQSEAQKRAGSPPKKKPIPSSTLHRWIRAFEKDGYTGLLPASRNGRPRQQVGGDEATWVSYAIGLLYEQPGRSLTRLELYLELTYPSLKITRSTLSRRLREHPAYPGILALRRGKRRRLHDLYEASRPHESWQLDGKGPFTVRLVNGRRLRVHLLSILDDHSRAILSTVVSHAEDTVAAIRVFRKAALAHGLPDRFQFDRGSAFDSHVFREGLARCGVHRNAVKPRHPEAQGKIEAYHRCLQRWLIDELKTQDVLDVDHLGQLVSAMIGVLYNRHFHREIKSTPEDRLAFALSERRISEQDLSRAFLITVSAKSDSKTGEVRLDGRHFKVPVEFAGRKSRFRYDPTSSDIAYLVASNGKEIAIPPFRRRPLPRTKGSHVVYPNGQLQKLVDVWQGKERPNAQPGFGLPDVFLALEKLVERAVPSSEREATLIVDFYRGHGPLPREPFLHAIDRTRTALGGGRPLATYLQDLERQIEASAKQQNSDQDHVPENQQ